MKNSGKSKPIAFNAGECATEQSKTQKEKIIALLQVFAKAKGKSMTDEEIGEINQSIHLMTTSLTKEEKKIFRQRFQVEIP